MEQDQATLLAQIYEKQGFCDIAQAAKVHAVEAAAEAAEDKLDADLEWKHQAEHKRMEERNGETQR